MTLRSAGTILDKPSCPYRAKQIINLFYPLIPPPTFGPEAGPESTDPTASGPRAQADHESQSPENHESNPPTAVIRELLQDLRDRGLEGVGLFVSDESPAIRSALELVYPEVAWQHCTFHRLAALRQTVGPTDYRNRMLAEANAALLAGMMAVG